MTANRIIAHVFLQPSLQLVNEAAMEQLVADHPYFSAARLLLARKVYQQTGNLQHPAVKKALLYTDQHHYAYQLITEEQVLQVVENRVPAIIPEDALPEEVHTALPENGAMAAHEAASAFPAAATEIPAYETAHHQVSETLIPETENITLEEDQIAADTITLEEEELAVAPAAISADAEQIAAAPETVAIAAPETNVTPAAIADFEPGNTTSAAATEVPPPPVATPSAKEEDLNASGPIKIFPMDAPEEETELIFQPLYTDDYFAYKRLKNPEEADALNEQGAAEMKSFTSWLRQMKDNFAGKSNKDWYHQQLHRLYEDDEEPEVSETVEKMAMDSIVFNNDIVSETLAEIWVRQQQYGNAIKIYQKLSLLNPDKNAYFAQKILELKSKTDKNK